MDDVDTKQRRKSVGVIPISKLDKSKEFRAYMEASRNFSDAKTRASDAKEAMKVVLKKRSASLSNLSSFDFTIHGDSVQVFERIGGGGQRRATRKNELVLD